MASIWALSLEQSDLSREVAFELGPKWVLGLRDPSL